MKIQHLIYRALFLTWLLQIGHGTLIAQTKLQVLTKKIEKTIPIDGQEVLRVEGDKSSIFIDTWAKNEVQVVLKLISKAPDKGIAEKELTFQRYIMEKRKGVIHLKNYLVVPHGTEKLGSIQISEYHIMVPKGCKLEIINQYGDVKVSNVFGVVDIDVKYGKIDLKNINAAVSLKSYFGDLIARNFDGQLSGTTNHTKINLDDVSGEVQLSATLGDVFIGSIGDLRSFKIEASKADITLENPDFERFNFNLDLQYGEILVPSIYKEHFKKLKNDSRTFVYNGPSNAATISLSTSFGNIVAK
ncbi:DUF4097 family beta strand repeat-containing protein [Fulvivirgaceae bacterium BMA10]|uniref:DUF4097 family beta strand repeat-containing protein n=1 Tax=Splendidivirga corallicola TaxID=3051826 RepID=A0ABT8KML9_9BACT|nr:DUF4097 family beta strand repeat-containing protein [Fulvivirgaceae bacterium BMA10]